MPSFGDNGQGGMNPGNAPDLCNLYKLNHNCPSPQPMNGPNTAPPAFPTYYVVRQCPDNSWRILYDVYFTKDTGHRHDWEWAVVKYVDDGTGSDNWVRDGVWMERDGDHPYTNWGDLDSTYFDDSDIDQNGQKNKDHPKLYFGKWHHPVFDTQQTQWFPITCPPTSEDDYRSDDYRYESWSWLSPGSAIDLSWDYGSADSYPPAWDSGGRKDICTFL
jgi:hypothetical protein